MANGLKKVNNKKKNKFQILIVGAGISGLVLAERYASIGKRVLILEKHDHIGGNCYDFYNDDGILVSKYGPHIFHTNYEDVWQYVQNFSDWRPYKHIVRAEVDGKLVPVPVNIETVNKLFNLKIKSEAEMTDWLNGQQVKVSRPKNSEEVAMTRVGKTLYEKIFKNYTLKQWNKHPKDLDPQVLARIPVRNNFDDQYFSDKYQYQPSLGFTNLFNNMVNSPMIEVKLNCDFFSSNEIKNLSNYEKVFYTGPVDRYFDYCFDKKGLEYRSLRFELETYDQEFFQKFPVINYPNEHSYTRIVEYKYLTGQKHSKTTISKEYPTNDGEPYYPVLTQKNRLLYKKYKQLIDELKNIYFIGRLAEYRYINMDEAFHNALHLFKKLES